MLIPLKIRQGHRLGVVKVPPSLPKPPPTVPYGINMSLATSGKIWFTYLNGVLGSIDTTTLVETTYDLHTQHLWGFTTDGTYLYICSLKSPTTLYKVDLTGTVIARYNIGNKLVNICFDGTNLWATDYEAKKIYKISTSGVVLATIATDNFPYSVVYQAGYVYVTYPFQDTSLLTLNSNTLGRIDVSTNALTEYVVGVAGDILYGLAADGTNIWATSNTDASNNVFKISPAGVTLATYSIGDKLFLLSYYPSVSMLGVSSITTGKHYTIDPATGTIYQEDTIGISPKNGSIDGFNYAYVGNYGSGNYSRFLITPATPAIPIPKLLLHFSSLPFLNSASPSGFSAPTISGSGTPALTTGVFSTAGTSANTDNALELVQSMLSGTEPLLGDYTIRCRIAYNHTGISTRGLISNGSSNEYLAIRGWKYALGASSDSVDSGVYVIIGGFQAISVERKAGTTYLYVDGVLTCTNSSVNAARYIGVEPITINLNGVIVDEFAYFSGVALANGASSYTVETTPFLP